jgi:hypothetical protein
MEDLEDVMETYNSENFPLRLQKKDQNQSLLVEAEASNWDGYKGQPADKTCIFLEFVWLEVQSRIFLYDQ